MQDNALVKSKGFTLFEKQKLRDEIKDLEILRVNHVAVMKSHHPQTIYKKAKAGKLPAYKDADGSLYFLKTEILDDVYQGARK